MESCQPIKRLKDKKKKVYCATYKIKLLFQTVTDYLFVINTIFGLSIYTFIKIFMNSKDVTLNGQGDSCGLWFVSAVMNLQVP